MQKVIKKMLEKRPFDIIVKVPCDKQNYFSITADHYARENRSKDRYGETLQACGCMHEDILNVAPMLKLFVDLHLSRPNGEPMYSVGNGLSWAGFGKYTKVNAIHLASHLRIDETLAERLIQFCEDRLWNDEAKRQMTHFIEKQKPRWKCEAEAAMKMFNEMEVTE